MSLVCGILGFFTAGLAGILGVIFGFVSLSKIKASRGTVGGRGLAIGGLVVSFSAVIRALTLLGAIFAMRGKLDSARLEHLGHRCGRAGLFSCRLFPLPICIS